MQKKYLETNIENEKMYNSGKTSDLRIGFYHDSQTLKVSES
jgi:hypothetical protein